MAIKGILNHILVRFSCLIVLLSNHSFSVTDTLQQGQVFKHGDQLLSAASGKFRLAFFYRHDGYHLGIQYNRLQPDNVDVPISYSTVWVANPNNPITDKSTNLSIDASDGNLKIFHSGGNPIPVSSVEGARNTSATLMSSGNLVLHEMNSDGSVKRVLWQSFDYPTDTLLPGMKLGFNLQTDHQWSLRSWLTVGNPAQGSFTLVMDRNDSNKLNVMCFYSHKAATTAMTRSNDDDDQKSDWRSNSPARTITATTMTTHAFSLSLSSFDSGCFVWFGGGG
ncbi:hypothetical protein Q3G72_003357 [Acer saccharum]|nr:hypothetical protein Q3G72_003357 [Acer saccharum]